MQSSSPLLVISQIDLMNWLMSVSNRGAGLQGSIPNYVEGFGGHATALYDLSATHGVLNQSACLLLVGHIVGITGKSCLLAKTSKWTPWSALTRNIRCNSSPALSIPSRSLLSTTKIIARVSGK